MNLSSKQIRELSRRSSETLFGIRSDEPEQCLSDDLCDNSKIRDKQEVTMDQHSVSYRNGFKVMQAQVQSSLPFLFRRESSRAANIRGVATLLKAEQALVDAKLIRIHSLPHNRTSKCLWEILPSGYVALDIPEPNWKSKGGYLHKFCAYRIANTYINNGYEAKIEYRHSNGKLVDLRAKSPSQEVFIEVCASRPLEKEISNIELDLQVAPFPQEVIMAVTERGMREPLATLIDERFENYRLPSKIRVVLAGDLIDTMRLSQ